MIRPTFLARGIDCDGAWPLRVARRNSWGQLFYSDARTVEHFGCDSFHPGRDVRCLPSVIPTGMKGEANIRSLSAEAVPKRLDPACFACTCFRLRWGLAVEGCSTEQLGTTVLL
ncbi:hypothetical protein CEE69_24795 [Rhodopirellula bahusiensis]|uniref:Uncharacterized protein n=1 Tax=Rhodopirellula bahusiensis TaxID=2014065 RepID=A0A2G1W1B4_9BACT|nr:hypothetical protein CEE69_24795 [Rhodopirellula bahusiensis]